MPPAFRAPPSSCPPRAAGPPALQEEKKRDEEKRKLKEEARPAGKPEQSAADVARRPEGGGSERGDPSVKPPDGHFKVTLIDLLGCPFRAPPLGGGGPRSIRDGGELETALVVFCLPRV